MITYCWLVMTAGSGLSRTDWQLTTGAISASDSSFHADFYTHQFPSFKIEYEECASEKIGESGGDEFLYTWLTRHEFGRKSEATHHNISETSNKKEISIYLIKNWKKSSTSMQRKNRKISKSIKKWSSSNSGKAQKMWRINLHLPNKGNTINAPKSLFFYSLFFGKLFIRTQWVSTILKCFWNLSTLQQFQIVQS